MKHDRPTLPDALTRLSRLGFLAPEDRGFMSRVQGRTHANLLAFLEGIAGAKRVALAAACRFDDAAVFEIIVSLLDEGARDEARFRCIEARLAAGMPPGYGFAANPSLGARAFLEGSTWAVLALAWHARLCRRSNALCAAGPDDDMDPGFREAFQRDRREALPPEMPELAPWRRAGDPRGAAPGEANVDEYIGLLRLLDGLLYRQARADAAYFSRHLGRALPPADEGRLLRETLSAYREQFIVRGGGEARFGSLLDSRVPPALVARITAAIASFRGEAVASA